MKLIMENWNRFLEEQGNNKLWVIAGPPAVGKSYLMDKVKALNAPNLIIQDIDYIPAVEAATPNWNEVPEDERDENSKTVMALKKAATPKMNSGINDFIIDHAEQDMFLVGIAWIDYRMPFKFPEHAEKICLYRDPKTVAQAYQDRAPRTGDSPKTGVTDESIKWIEDEFKRYESQGWPLATAEEIVALVKSHYQQEEA